MSKGNKMSFERAEVKNNIVKMRLFRAYTHDELQLGVTKLFILCVLQNGLPCPGVEEWQVQSSSPL